MELRWRDGTVAMLVALLVGCTEDKTAEPCVGIECGQGRCVSDGISAFCDCEPGFEAIGLRCIAQPDGGDADSDTDTETDTDSGSDTGSDSETDSDSDTVPDTETDTECADSDEDGHGSVACGGGDCNDADGFVHSGAPDNEGAATDGVDQNCDEEDGLIGDEDDDGYDPGTPTAPCATRRTRVARGFSQRSIAPAPRAMTLRSRSIRTEPCASPTLTTPTTTFATCDRAAHDALKCASVIRRRRRGPAVLPGLGCCSLRSVHVSYCG